MAAHKNYFDQRHYSNTGDYIPMIITRIFRNKKTFKKERHNFGNAYTLKLWVASMCGAQGDYIYLPGVKHEDLLF